VVANPFSGLSTGEKIAVALGGAGVAWFAIKQHQSSSAASSSAIDPLTGLPASQDNQPDPVTGEAYLAEAQQYGSVSAAEQALSGSGLSGGYYGTGGSGLIGTSTGASLVPANTVQGTAYATNAAWAQAVEAGLTDIGYAPTDISAALGRYLSGLSETAAQAGIVQAANAEYGPPPVGSFQVIQAPAAGPVSTGSGPMENQTGTVTSNQTHETAKVATTDGGHTWHYTGPGGAGPVKNQTGTVHSSPPPAGTGGHASVKTSDGGLTWIYV
jgi:hypothetical protein